MNSLFPPKHLLLLAILAFSEFTLSAQSLPFSWTLSSPATTFEVDSNGTLVAAGTYDTSTTLSGVETGTGTRLLWFPGFAAFRTGNGNWTTGNIGHYSVAMGGDVVASGAYSAAMGNVAVASGYSSSAFNFHTSATGDYSAALNWYTVASGDYSVALGYLSLASGSKASAFGNDTEASGEASAAFGYQSLSSGIYSSAFNYESWAAGINSAAFNDLTLAQAYDSFAVGANNVGAGNSTHWISTDPIFEVGNGVVETGGVISYTAPSDAFVVYKNGNAALQGTLTVAPGGDIPMFSN